MIIFYPPPPPSASPYLIMAPFFCFCLSQFVPTILNSTASIRCPTPPLVLDSVVPLPLSYWCFVLYWSGTRLPPTFDLFFIAFGDREKLDLSCDTFGKERLVLPGKTEASKPFQIKTEASKPSSVEKNVFV
jgi:hypothetical protein